MHIILGGTGHVGSALTDTLLHTGEPVTVVTRDPTHAPPWEARGARTAVADVRDADALREVFSRGTRAFLLSPHADPSTDSVAEEKRSVASIVEALDGSGLEKVVVQSTYGAQPGKGTGDLNVLYDLEQGAAGVVPTAVVRAAYYMSNWDGALATARDEGAVHTFFPADFALPMVAPRDLGRAAARLLTEPPDRTGVHYVEGPERYSSADVAAVFAELLGRPVRAVETPRGEWVAALKTIGFSDAAAASYAAMTAATLDGEFPKLSDVEQGETTLRSYVTELVERSQGGG